MNKLKKILYSIITLTYTSISFSSTPHIKHAATIAYCALSSDRYKLPTHSSSLQKKFECSFDSNDLDNDLFKPYEEFKENIHVMILKAINNFLVGKKLNKITDQDNAIKDRLQSLQAIQESIDTILDETDTKKLSCHILDIKELSRNLSPEQDKKIIEFVQIIDDNQHKSGLFDLPFWRQTFKEQNINKDTISELSIMSDAALNKSAWEIFALIIKKQ